MANTFKTGKTYQTRSICDSDCIISVTVKGRTAKTIRTVDRHGRPKTLRIFMDYDGNEAVRPWGNYSMCPIISA